MAAKKTSKKEAKQIKINFENEKAQKLNKQAEENNAPVFKFAAPFVLMVFGVILAICFITVQLMGYDDGAGVVGYAVQWLVCGIFGSAAFLLPALFFYIGLKKCIYNVRWSSRSKRKPTAESNPSKDRRAISVITVTGILFVLCISLIFGVVNDYFGFDIVEMWVDAAENPADGYGGLIGSSIGALMVMCFEQLISLIILCVLAAVFAFFMLGFTPSGVIAFITERRDIARERRAREDEEALRLAAEAEADARKHKNRVMAATINQEEAVAVKQNVPKQKKNMSVDELLSEQTVEEKKAEEPELELKPLDMSAIFAAPSQNTDNVYIGVDGKVTQMPDETQIEKKEEGEGDDFGGDPTFDAKEFSGVQSILDGLQTSGSIPQKEEAQRAPSPADDVTKLLDDIDDNEKEDVDIIDLEQIENEELLSEMAAVAPEEGVEEVEVVTPYVFPPVDMLTPNPNAAEEDYSQELQENAQRLMETLRSFKVSIKEITYSRGPTITRYELKPDAGIRVRAIANLVDDIALNLATTGVRIEAPIPNKPAVGIEVPNRTRATVYLRDLIETPKFFESKSRLTSCLGMDVGGNPIYFDIAKMPHLLIAGATGMGKSVCINTIIVSLLYKAKPDELKLILIDPKKVEFTIYKNIPHLYAPIVSDPKKAAGALASAVAEMERRFEMIEDAGVRDISGYNAVTENDPDREYMPHMVIIIDELADLMMTAPDEVETSICRLAQKARAAGIHIIIGTQRPSVDVITGLIKANIPSRIACTVASQTDSRTILDIGGAEKLIGRGDMLFAPVGASKPMRVQGAFVSEGEVENIVTFIRDNNAAGKFNAEFIERINEEAAKCGMKKNAQSNAGFDSDSDGEVEGGDSKFNEAVKLAIEEGKISTSLMQRRLGVGYGRAAKIIDAMEERGYVSKPDGNKPRRVLISMEEYMRRKMDNELDDISDDEL